MSGKTIDEIANTIWQRGYDAGRKAERDESAKHGAAKYERGRQDVLEELEEWLFPQEQEQEERPPDAAPAVKSESERAPTRTRAIKWLNAQPDGASHSEWLKAGEAGDHAALWRLKKRGYARQDPETLRYYATEKAKECLTTA